MDGVTRPASVLLRYGAAGFGPAPPRVPEWALPREAQDSRQRYRTLLAPTQDVAKGDPLRRPRSTPGVA